MANSVNHPSGGGHNHEKVWFEAFAKELLENLFPESYSNLILSDKPDILMGEKHGIEVTRSFYPDQEEKNKLFELIQKQTIDPSNIRQTKIIQKLESQGAKLILVKGKICGMLVDRELRPITEKEMINSVICKESKAYDTVDIVDLFIYSPSAHIPGWFDDNIVHDFFAELIDVPFNTVFVYTYHVLYSYNIPTKTTIKRTIDDATYDICSKRASEYAGKLE